MVKSICNFNQSKKEAWILPHIVPHVFLIFLCQRNIMLRKHVHYETTYKRITHDTHGYW